MKTAAAFIGLALSAGTALGWSEDWNNYDPTNDFGKPTGRMFMEMVWAVNERALAAKSAAGDHFYNYPGMNTETIFPGSYLDNTTYICLQTNWSDEIGDYVVTTGALYRSEFWEPSVAQVSELVRTAYEVLPYFMPAGTESFTNRFAPYVAPTTVDPSVPLWVYHLANSYMTYSDESGLHYYTNYYGQRYVDLAMHLAWPSNPISILGGRMTTAATNKPIPVYLIDYPVHESPPGTTLTNQILNVFTVTECGTPGTPWELVGNATTNPFTGESFYNPRAEYGTHECETLKIEWDGTNGWWTNTTFTFGVHVAAKTNFEMYWATTNLSDWDFSPSYRYANGGYSIYEAYPTNEMEISGKLPISLTCTNILPMNVRILSGNLFTGLVPNVVARVNGIKPAGTWGDGGSDLRAGFADWNPSVSRLFKLREIIDLYGNATLAQATVAENGWSSWATNSGTYYNDPAHVGCDDCVFPVWFGAETHYAQTNEDYDVYDFATGTWTNTLSPVDFNSYTFYAWRADHVAASVYAHGEVSGSSGNFTGTRNSRRYCAQVDVASDYATGRMPTGDGYPYIEECDFYLTSASNLTDRLHGYVTNSMTYYGTAAFNATSAIYRGDGYHVIDTNLTFNADDAWMTNLNATCQQAWIDGPYTCTGGTNWSKKTVEAEAAFNVSGIARWRFSTNFDAYWEMYPACTNVP